MPRLVVAGLVLVLVAGSCGDDDSGARTAPSTATTKTTTPGPADVVIEDERCEPAVELIDDPDYGLVGVTSDIDTGNGPSDEVLCTFSLLVPPQDTQQKQTRTVVIAADGSAVEQ